MNKETELQLLARSKFLLFKYESNWNSEQKERALVLFKMYPEIKKAYYLIISFRAFYSLTNKKNRIKAEKKLKKWLAKASISNISEILNFASTVSNHKNEILNHFNSGDTNAISESINKRFIINNHGTRDPDFLFFRLQKILS